MKKYIILTLLAATFALGANAKKTFQLKGTIDEGINDIGYIVGMFDGCGGLGFPTRGAEIIKPDGQRYFYQTDLEEITLGCLCILNNDGTVGKGRYEMVFVPGKTAELTMHDGRYSLSGTAFYKQFAEAIDAFSIDTEDYENQVLEILKENTDKPAYFVAAFQTPVLLSDENLRKAYDLLPDETKQGIYGKFLRKYLL